MPLVKIVQIPFLENLLNIFKKILVTPITGTKNAKTTYLDCPTKDKIRVSWNSLPTESIFSDQRPRGRKEKRLSPTIKKNQYSIFSYINKNTVLMNSINIKLHALYQSILI